MRYVLMLCILFSMVSFCQAEPNGGVLVAERVIRLPEDGQKWYISVIGSNDERYKEILSWFDSGKLKDLKDKVHFFPVTKDMPVYERYAPGIKSLPLVRVQDADGKVLYEVSGRDIPMTGEALYNAIANGVNGTEEWLPWRRHNKKDEPKPEPQPQPDVTPGPVDPLEQPLDNGAAPVIEPVDEIPYSLILVCVTIFIVGLGISLIEHRKK